MRSGPPLSEDSRVHKPCSRGLATLLLGISLHRKLSKGACCVRERSWRGDARKPPNWSPGQPNLFQSRIHDAEDLQSGEHAHEGRGHVLAEVEKGAVCAIPC